MSMPPDSVVRPLAEFMPVDIAEQALKKFESRRSASGLFHSAWSHVEYALCQEANLDDEMRAYYFDYAQEMLGQIINADLSGEIYGRAITRPASQDQLLGALTLSSYAPVFRQRAFGETTTHTDCAKLYDSLGYAMRYLRPLEIDEPPQWRMAEVAMLALSARTMQPEFLLYPASPREESAAKAQFNHDSYFMNACDKLPLQQKLIRTDKVYDECITILTLEPLLDKTTARAHLETRRARADKLSQLFAIIIAETAGETLDPREKQFLDIMTRAVVAHRFAGEQVLAA